MLGIVLILVPAGDLEDPLTDQRLQRMADRARAPVGNTGRQCCTETERRISFGEPTETTITGELGTIEARLEGGGRELELDRLTTQGISWGGSCRTQSLGGST